MKKTLLKAVTVLCLVGLKAVSAWSGEQPRTAHAESAIDAITKLENDQIQADLSGDISYYENTLADDWIHGTGAGTWLTKDSYLKLLRDTSGRPLKSSAISNLSVHVYDGAAVATYDQVYEAFIQGKYQKRKVINTDVFVKRGDRWVMVVSHTSRVQ
jgi:hypothetical protein